MTRAETTREGSFLLIGPGAGLRPESGQSCANGPGIHGMPGRPLTTARKVCELEEAALEVSAETFFAMPSAYKKPPTRNDPVHAAWHAAYVATLDASIRVEHLGDVMRARAGIKEPGPAAVMLAERIKGGDDGEITPADGADDPPPRARA